MAIDNILSLIVPYAECETFNLILAVILPIFTKYTSFIAVCWTTLSKDILENRAVAYFVFIC